MYSRPEFPIYPRCVDPQIHNHAKTHTDNVGNVGSERNLRWVNVQLVPKSNDQIAFVLNLHICRISQKSDNLFESYRRLNRQIECKIDYSKLCP
jgi:hypothetical protein